MNKVLPQSRSRITSIDALRALTLLGILFTHAKSGFGFVFQGDYATIDKILNSFISLFLTHKCNLIFSVLFGISFYLILRNPLNSSRKFVWRCFLLMIIGIFNKFFYTYDALMWYGLWGMFLVCIRRLHVNKILAIFIILTLLTAFLRLLSLGNLLFGVSEMERYGGSKSLTDIIFYPYAVIDYFRLLFNYGIFVTLSYFVLGYWIARIGVIERLDKIVTLRVVFILGILFAMSFIFKIVFGSSHFLRLFSNYSGSFTYSAIIIYLYYHNNQIQRLLRYFEPYGKLGLTNYSTMGIIGVIMMSDFGLGLYQYNVAYALGCFLALYSFQMIFSIVWLKYFRYGPMEYVWRIATERKMINNRI